MNQPPARSIFAKIFKNFIDSLKPRRWSGDLKGADYFGNKYYEIPPSSNRRKRARYFEPPENDNFEQELPAEWEAWLRGRRKEPPSEEEVLRSLAIMQMKKKNAVAVEAKAGQVTLRDKGMESFPKRTEYEYTPGSSKSRK